MAEVLATVAIILILGSLVVMNVVSFQANLRQKALDAKAEIIYTAAQEQMTRIMASGREDVMAAPIEEPATDTYADPSKHLVRYIPAVNAIPGDVTQDSVDPWHICYVTSEELNIDGTESGNPNNSNISGANLLFGRGGLDDELLNGHWVIEYDYKSLTVYSVYYSEGSYNCASSDEGYASDSFKEAFNRELRSHAFRLEANKTLGSGNFVGYYGGGATSANAGTSLKPSVKISNGEKLTATISATLPMAVSADVAFMVTLTDSYGNSTRAYYCMAREKDLFNNSIGIPVYAADLTGKVVSYPINTSVSNATFTCKGLDYKLELTLDSLEDDGSMRFTKLYGWQSPAAAADAPAAVHPLVEGSDIHIEVQAICERSALVGSGYYGRGDNTSFNSLFDDTFLFSTPSTKVSRGVEDGDSVAGISCGRHLQNLDESSGLNASYWRSGTNSVPFFTTAYQDASFDFGNSISGDTDFKAWMSTYGSDNAAGASYFNGLDSNGRPCFKPIVNNMLKSFSGKASAAAPDASGSVIAHLNIKEHGDAALFAGGTSMQALKSLSNITLTGSTVSSTGDGTYRAAGLIAVNAVVNTPENNYKLVIDNCQLYLNPNKDISEPADDPTPWITGPTAGGLVGTNRGNLTIANSSASTVVKGTGGYAGGLVGSTTGTLTIERSYADSYLKAHSTGGLVGSGVATVRYSYAAGYLFMPGEGSAAAGLVNGIAKIENSYAAMTVQNTLPASYEYYRTSKTGERHTNVLYLDTELTKSSGAVDKPQSAVIGDEPFLSTASPESVLERIGENPENPANFTLAAASISAPYNLMNQGLDSYTWPTIVTAPTASTASKNLAHYGDWPAAFQPGALVYYEKYLFVDRTTKKGVYTCYGFEGANVKSTLINDARFKTGSTRWAFKAGTGGAPTGVLAERTGNNEDIIVVGDGYGVVYEGELLETVTAKLLLPDKSKPRDQWQSETCTLGGTKHEVKTSSKDYFLYPLDKKTFSNTKFVNSDSYYLAIDIDNTVTKNENGTTVTTPNTDRYFFNPHFAKTVRRAGTSVMPVAPSAANSTNYIYLRTGRQLNNLSLFYEHDASGTAPGYRDVTKECIFTQQRNIAFTDYEWASFGLSGTKIRSQAPIGTGEDSQGRSFIASYDGGCNMITDVSFVTEQGDYVGMFGYLGTGSKVENVVLCTDYQPRKGAAEGTLESLKHTYYVQRKGAMQKNEEVHMGVLAGYSKGTITNCAAAGYYLAGEDGTVHAYTGSSSNIGGLVGTNEGTITNCSADSPKLRLSLFETTANAAGFVGTNTISGTISNCYALGAIDVVEAPRSDVSVAGFAGNNQGSIQNCYSATAIFSSGENTEVYGFSPVGGLVKNCDYLNGGTYTYVGRMYAFNFNTNKNYGYGDPIRYGDLKSQRALAPVTAGNSFVHSLTKTTAAEAYYPYRGVVQRAGSTPSKPVYVHYGNWQDEVVLGTLGIFYWELEENSSNSGYHMTYLGSSEELVNNKWEPKLSGSSSLCNAHDDDGVITEYGYGVYVQKGEEEFTTISWGGSTYGVECSSGATANLKALNENPSKFNLEASEQLAIQMENTDTTSREYSFFAFTTCDAGNEEYISLNGGAGESAKQNGTVTLEFKNTSSSKAKSALYTYEISPFFANALRVKEIKIDGSTKSLPSSLNIVSAYDERSIDCLTEPGFLGSSKDGVDNANHYEVRSLQQLQYINWNSREKNTHELVYDGNKMNYPYLQYTTGNGQKRIDAEKKRAARAWLQTHDLTRTQFWSSEGSEYFSPIAGAGTSSNNSDYNAKLYAWFGGQYNGQSYAINNVAVHSKSFFVGLFGITAGATIKNVILHGKSSEAIIERVADSDDPLGAYALGGLVGVAYKYSGEEASDNTIINCAVSGYQIVDSSKNQEGLGEVCIGGLIGVANVNLKKCSAVANIVVRPQYDGVTGKNGNFIRVGGLVGGLLDTVENSYSGGTITVEREALLETRDSNGTRLDDLITPNPQKAVFSKSTHIFLAGIAGCAFASQFTNFTGNKDGDMKVRNCYTYMQFPEMTGTIRSISMIASLADRHNLGKPPLFTNCYYLDSCAQFKRTFPNYYFIKKNNTAMLLSDLLDADDEQEKMLQGNADYLSSYLGDGNNTKTGVGVQDGCTVASKSYEDMSADSFVKSLNGVAQESETLGTPWAFVTKKDNDENRIDGKYSFPSIAELEGMNYPFPAVVRQNDLTFGTVADPVYVYVHYGDWPSDGSIWAEGRGTMDIFSDMDLDGSTGNEAGYAYKTFRLYVDPQKYGGAPPNAADESLYTIEGGYAEIANVDVLHDRVEGYEDYIAYDVTIKALKEGFTTVCFNTAKEPGAYFILQVTANWELSAAAEADSEGHPTVFDPVTNTLRIRNSAAYSAQLRLQAHDAGGKKDLSSLVTWVSPPEIDVKGALDCSLSKSDNNLLKVTRLSNGPVVIAVEANGTYNGKTYTKKLYINAEMPVSVGLSNAIMGENGSYPSKLYNEVDVGGPAREGSPSMSSQKPTHDFGLPRNIYLYTQAAEDYLDVASNVVEVVVSDGGTTETITPGKVGSNYCIELDKVLRPRDGYAYVAGALRYVNTAPKSDNVSVTVKLQGGYSLKTTVPKASVKPAQLFVVKLNMGGDRTEEFVINEPGTSCLPEGYTQRYAGGAYDRWKLASAQKTWTFDGWYNNKGKNARKVLDGDGSIVVDTLQGAISGGKFADKGSLTLYARWSSSKDVWKPTSEMDTTGGTDYLIASADMSNTTASVFYLDIPADGTEPVDSTNRGRGTYLREEYAHNTAGVSGDYIEKSYDYYSDSTRGYLWTADTLEINNKTVSILRNKAFGGKYILAENDCNVNGKWAITATTKIQPRIDDKGVDTTDRRVSITLADNGQISAGTGAIKYDSGKVSLLVSDNNARRVCLYKSASVPVYSFCYYPELKLMNGDLETASIPINPNTPVATVAQASLSGSGGWALLGWYGSKAEKAAKVLKADGSAVAAGGLAVTEDVTLYAKWRNGALSDAFERVDSSSELTDGKQYIILDGVRAVKRTGNGILYNREGYTMPSTHKYISASDSPVDAFEQRNTEFRWTVNKPLGGDQFTLSLIHNKVQLYISQDTADPSKIALGNDADKAIVWEWDGKKLLAKTPAELVGKCLKFVPSTAENPDNTDASKGELPYWGLLDAQDVPVFSFYRLTDKNADEEKLFKVSWDAH